MFILDLDDTIIQFTNSFCTVREFHLSCMGFDDEDEIIKPWYCSDVCKTEAEKYRFCTCKIDRGLDIDMIGCDNTSCTNGTWFHLDCVNIDKIPGMSPVCIHLSLHYI